jgi:hypothetical protein
LPIKNQTEELSFKIIKPAIPKEITEKNYILAIKGLIHG